MRNFKKKLFVMCSVAMICFGLVCFSACDTQLVVWGTMDVLTFGSIGYGTEKIEEGETKDRVNSMIDGIAGVIDGAKGVFDWVMKVVTPQQ